MGRMLVRCVVVSMLFGAAAAAPVAAAVRTGPAAGQSVAAPTTGSGWVPVGSPTSAAWVKHAGDDHGLNYGLVTTSQPDPTQLYGVSYGGADLALSALPTTDPSQITALSYDFLPAQLNSSGGSPRLVVCFSDSTSDCNSNGDLGPLYWTSTTTWTHVDGFAPPDVNKNIWINDGGSCGNAVEEPSWNAIVACHPPVPPATRTTITDIFVVNDSGWQYPSGSSETITLDNLDVNGVTASGP